MSYFMNKTFTIILPVYNEEDNLQRVEKELSNYIKTCPVKADVLIVNDGSSDNSLQIIENICLHNTNFSFITFEKNYGLSTAIKAGFDHV